MGEMPLEDFITLPDTVSLIVMNGSLTSEAFRRVHHIRPGIALTGGYHIDYVDRSRIDGMITETGENILSMLPIVFGLLDQQNLDAAGILQVQRHPYLDLRGRGNLLGFVDTGINYTQKAFQYEDGTSKINTYGTRPSEGTRRKAFILERNIRKNRSTAPCDREIPWRLSLTGIR